MVLCLVSVVNAHVEIIIPKGGGGRKVLPAEAFRVRATHFRGQGKVSNEQPGPFPSQLLEGEYRTALQCSRSDI